MELIKIEHGRIGGGTVQTINARELHAFLEVGKDFSTWIKDRIEQYGFLENQDFICSPILGSNGRGGHNRKDYHLTLDMAKELAMVERNDKGKQARYKILEHSLEIVSKNSKELISIINDADNYIASKEFRKQPYILSYAEDFTDSTYVDYLTWQTKTVKRDLS